MAAVDLETTITLALSVTDRKTSAKWYAEMLGFEEMYSIDEAGWSELQTNTDGVTIGLGEQVEPSPGNCTPVFGVKDIDQARAALEGLDVRFDGPTEEIPGMVKLATFYDPDDNALMLAQNLTQTD